MESRPQNPEFRINPENFQSCIPSMHAQIGPIWAESGQNAQVEPMWVGKI